MANKGAILSGLVERFALRNLAKLSIDTSGRLRIASEATTQTGTWNVATITTVNTYGLFTQAGVSQMKSHQDYQGSFRSRLVVT